MPTPDTDRDAAETVILHYPFHGRWRAQNSPARRVPSHGTHLLGTTYAIDFVGVDDRGRSAPWGWRAALATERPKDFVGFGRPILAPVSGTVVAVHDGELDHEARRSVPAGIPYLLSQARRLREGVPAIAGNHVVIALNPDGPFVLLAHLRAGSVTVRVGQDVTTGEPVGACGNSGNSIQPHVHVQATDTLPDVGARGLPIAFVVDGGPPQLPTERQIVTA